MIGRIVVLDEIDGHEMAALMVDGQLQELAIDFESEQPLPGAIYRAVASRPMKGQGGIFVKLPDGQTGFLRQISGIAPGQRLLVQISGPAEPGKAMPVTTRLLFKSRYAIITPDAPGLNISRQIREDDIRAELQALAEAGMKGAAENLGLIIRSSCADADLEDITADIASVRALAEAVLADTTGEPELLVDAPSAHELAWREWLEPQPDDVIDEAGSFNQLGVSEQLDDLIDPRVDLPTGGHMWIEATRALVAIDINTGNDTSPAAALKVNVAAARDLPRQLRLRGLGGQVVVDFAPMPKKDRHILDQVIKASFKTDGSCSLAGWTTLGLYELTKRRDRISLLEVWE